MAGSVGSTISGRLLDYRGSRWLRLQPKLGTLWGHRADRRRA